MTPLYNGNEYYKKMLDLQERLRKSEEERIRLEERFSLLEHESRSRHETCINRLRMRYIDFLEEQQARDERNHQLLGALDRVDSSLALMTAKTDRLGTLRKQYEVSMLARYENRRPNGSVTGDSGVASQNDEGHRKCLDLCRGNGNVGLASSRSKPIRDGPRPNRASNSTSQLRPGSSYGSNWAGIRCESSRMYQPSLAISRSSQGLAGQALTRGNGLSDGYKGPGHLTRFPGSKASSDPRESIFQSLRHDNRSSPVASSWDYRRNDPPHYREADHVLHPTGTNPGQSSKYGRSVVRNLAASGAYDSIVSAPRSFNSSPAHARDFYERTLDSNAIPNLEDRKIVSSSLRSPKLRDILRQELGDEEEHTGHLVENQLERYISKIRSLHRVAEPQSLEEIDHEQNTSGDLLNVTLSDDGLDLSVEDKPGDRLLPQELGNVLALASDLANQTATNATSVAKNMHQRLSAGDGIEGNDAEVNVALKSERNENDEPIVVPEAGDQLTSINPLLDQPESHENENVSGNEKHESLAKNGISGNVAKPHSELAPRLTQNIHDIAKLIRSSEDTDRDEYVSGRIGTNSVNEDNSTCFNERSIPQVPEDKRDKFSSRASSRNLLEESPYKLASGEERENDEHLHDAVEDLEPWNLSALERRVQEIILNDEAQDDFIERETGRDVGATARHLEHEHEDLAIEEEIVEAEAYGRKTNESIVGNEALALEDSWKDNEKSQEEPKNQEPSGPADGSRIESQEKDVTGLSEREFVEDINYGSANDGVNLNVDYEPNQADVNYTNQGNNYPDNSIAEYEYNADGQYQVPDEQYPQYNPNDGAQYDGNQGQRYEYAEEQYVQDSHRSDSVQHSNQQNYVQDPNQQIYVENANEENYIRDDNQQNYVQDPNQQDYVQDATHEDYVQDPNQQNFVQDPNQQDYVQDPNGQEWLQDPNQEYDADVNQQYLNDPNQQYSGVPEQQYAADPNNQYLADQQYSEDQQYPAQPEEAYSERVDGDQLYLNTSDYVQGVNEDYAASTTENPYPEAQGYPGAQEDPVVPHESPGNVQQSPEQLTSLDTSNFSPKANTTTKKTKDVIKSILDSDTDTTIEKNVSNTESDFDFN